MADQEQKCARPPGILISRVSDNTSRRDLWQHNEYNLSLVGHELDNTVTLQYKIALITP